MVTRTVGRAWVLIVQSSITTPQASYLSPLQNGAVYTSSLLHLLGVRAG